MAKATIKVTKKVANVSIKSPWSFLTGWLTGTLIVGILISIYTSGLSNRYVSFLYRISHATRRDIVALILLLGLTVIFLAYARAKFYFSSRWLWATVTYNTIILIIKFTISPRPYFGEHGNLLSALFSALLVSLLYLFIFGLLYLFFDGKLLNQKLHKALITTTEGKALLAVGLFMAVTLARIGLFNLPGLANTNAATYLSGFFRSGSTILSGILFLMILAGVEAFAQVRRREDLKYFFALGVSLILIIHIWWAVFVARGF